MGFLSTGIPFCNILVEQSQPSVQRHREPALREHDYDACGNGCILVRDQVRWYHQTMLLFFNKEMFCN